MAEKKAKDASQENEMVASAPLSLRALTHRDVAAATQCGLEAWHSTIGGCLEALAPLQLVELGEAFRLYLSAFAAGTAGEGEQLIVAEKESAILGFCGFEGRSGYLSDLWVSPAWQGKGVGLALMEATRRSMRDLGRDFLTLEVLAQNTRARAFYKKQGFVETGRCVKYDPVLKRKLMKISMMQRL